LRFQGRTARYGKVGKALLLLCPSELAMVQRLEAKRVPIVRTEANATKVSTVIPRFQALCAESPEIKYLAQKVAWG
jgi:ATP-dependent RNA helicase DDX10/DBP4